MGDTYSREQEAPFNMAIATLQRLDDNLKEIKLLYLRYPQDSIQKLKAHIDLVKSFYLNAIPLLENVKDNKRGSSKKKEGEEGQEEKLKKLQKEILEFKVGIQTKVINGIQKSREVYDHKKEVRLNEILCELQTILKRFFMPGKKEAEGLI